MGVTIENPVTDKVQGFSVNTKKNDSIEKNELTYKHCVKADALRIQNYFVESIDEYLKAIVYDEANYEAYKGLGLAYKELGLQKSAIESLEKAKRLYPFDKTIHFELGCCYNMTNQFKKATKEFQRTIRLDNGHVDAQFNLALTHEMDGENKLAIQIYLKIMEEHPSYIAAYNNLGSLYMRMNMYWDSLQIFSKIVKISPDYTRAYLGMAVCFDKLDRVNDSIRYYKKYLRYKPDTLNARYISDRILALKSTRMPKKSALRLVAC